MNLQLQKISVKWCRHAFSISAIVWVANGNEDVHPEILSPLKYLERYIGEPQFEEIAKFTNMYALQKSVNFKPRK